MGNLGLGRARRVGGTMTLDAALSTFERAHGALGLGPSRAPPRSRRVRRTDARAQSACPRESAVLPIDRRLIDPVEEALKRSPLQLCV